MLRRFCPAWPQCSGLILEQFLFWVFHLQTPQRETVIFHPDMNPAWERDYSLSSAAYNSETAMWEQISLTQVHTVQISGVYWTVCVRTRAHIRTAGFLRQCFEKLTRTRRQKLPGDLESEQHRQLILMFVHSLCIEMRTGNICKCWQWNRESLSTGPSGYTVWSYLMLYHN